MVNRRLLSLLKRAYAGEAEAQLLLGKVYLSGGSTLYPIPTSALLWLSRAAYQGSKEARLLIGSTFPPAFTKQLGNPEFVKECYRTAIEAGVSKAKEWLAQLDKPRVRQIRSSYVLGEKSFIPFPIDARLMRSKIL